MILFPIIEKNKKLKTIYKAKKVMITFDGRSAESSLKRGQAIIRLGGVENVEFISLKWLHSNFGRCCDSNVSEIIPLTPQNFHPALCLAAVLHTFIHKLQKSAKALYLK